MLISILSKNNSNSNQNNCQLPRPVKRISSNSNDLFISLATENKPLATVASPGSSSSFCLSLSPSKFSNSNAIARLHMSPQHLSPSNASQNQQHYSADVFGHSSLPSPPLPPPPPNPSSTNNQPNLLLLTPSMQPSNLLLKTTTTATTAANPTNLNTFGRSNTLDRKMKPSSSQSPTTQQLMLNLNNNNNNTKQHNDINLSTIYSNSLERSYSQRQYLQSNGYSQSPHRNSLSISLRSPTASSKISHLPCHEPILENGNYLISNSASTNDIISNAGNMQQLKSDLENARNRIITLTNQLNTNVSLLFFF